MCAIVPDARRRRRRRRCPSLPPRHAVRTWNRKENNKKQQWAGKGAEPSCLSLFTVVVVVVADWWLFSWRGVFFCGDRGEHAHLLGLCAISRTYVCCGYTGEMWTMMLGIVAVLLLMIATVKVRRRLSLPVYALPEYPGLHLRWLVDSICFVFDIS